MRQGRYLCHCSLLLPFPLSLGRCLSMRGSITFFVSLMGKPGLALVFLSAALFSADFGYRNDIVVQSFLLLSSFFEEKKKELFFAEISAHTCAHMKYNLCTLDVYRHVHCYDSHCTFVCNLTFSQSIMEACACKGRHCGLREGISLLDASILRLRTVRNCVPFPWIDVFMCIHFFLFLVVDDPITSVCVVSRHYGFA
uniref:Uncharacterized protein TCIL3000_10_2670 n=1 Tax=Trypanosoma congolense (strain IL3000) TaxID=1068625 RepID=G0UVU0_TRYCI|nr:unnamed protein product [Trypanosoma congolense IL3000]